MSVYMPDTQIESICAYTPAVPELRIYEIWDIPIGPHPMAMFEVNLFTPGRRLPSGRSLLKRKLTEEAQFGAFIPWLVINRGPLSALIHPNTGEDERDHTQRATWMGQPLPLNLRIFKRMKAKQEAAAQGLTQAS